MKCNNSVRVSLFEWNSQYDWTNLNFYTIKACSSRIIIIINLQMREIVHI